MPEERVQKILAKAGYGSRRRCEEIIDAGRVRVNGLKINLGSKADLQKDQIQVDGRAIPKNNYLIYLAVYKPRGVLSSTKSEQGYKSVLDLVPTTDRIYPVGRLDVESEGLLILTNDGELTNLITHPKYGHEKEYKVLVSTRPDQEQLEIWRRGVVLSDGYRTRPIIIHIDKVQGKGTWLRIIMTEGRKRQIRESATIIGLTIVKLIRTRIGTLNIGNLKSGQYRHISPKEISELKKTPVRDKRISAK